MRLIVNKSDRTAGSVYLDVHRNTQCVCQNHSRLDTRRLAKTTVGTCVHTGACTWKGARTRSVVAQAPPSSRRLLKDVTGAFGTDADSRVEPRVHQIAHDHHGNGAEAAAGPPGTLRARRKCVVRDRLRRRALKHRNLSVYIAHNQFSTLHMPQGEPLIRLTGCG